MVEQSQKINITSNRRTDNYNQRMRNAWNGGNYQLYREMGERHPLDYPAFYADLDGPVRGGGHYGSSVSQVVSRISELIEGHDFSNTPIVLGSKRGENAIEGRKILENILESNELEIVQGSLLEKFPSLKITLEE